MTRPIGAWRDPHVRGTGAPSRFPTGRSARGMACRSDVRLRRSRSAGRYICCEQRSRKNVIRTVPVFGAHLAATAKIYGLTLATPSVADFAGLDVDVLNPFEA